MKTQPVPRNLRDCDMAIRVRQWNETFKNTEELSILNADDLRTSSLMFS